jgi:hypothetical protein
MRIASWVRGPLGAEEDQIEQDLRQYARSLAPGAEVIDRLQRAARSSFAESHPQPVERRPIAPSEGTFLRRRASSLVLGILLFAAALGDIRLCSGLSVAGFGALVPAASGALGGAFILIGALVAVVALLELVFAFGVWARRDWARPLGLITETAGIVLSAAWVLAGAALPLQVLMGVVSFGLLMALFVDGVPEAMESAPAGFPRHLPA